MEGASLVTGAKGFLGSAVARALLAEGHAVRVLARPGGERRNLAGLPLDLVEGRLEDANSLLRAAQGCRYVFHVAADYRIWVPDPQSMLRTNLDGSRAMMRAALAAGVERVVYTSSVAVLGHADVADEGTSGTLADMVGAYKRSKFLAEAEVMRMVREEGLPAVVVNPSTPIGPRDVRPTPTGRVVVEAARGRMPAYVDTGLNVVHVNDVAQGHLLALARGTVGERYVLGGDNLSLADILTHVAERVGRRPPALRLPRLPLLPLALAAEWRARLLGGEPMLTVNGLKMAAHRMWFSSAKAERVLGYRHRPAGEALDDAIAWFRAAGYLR